MTLSLLVIAIASLICITSSVRLQESTTRNCNYAVDLWWLTATPPTLSPTLEPTNEPTKSPTPDPTVFNETITTRAEGESEREDVLIASAVSVSLLLLLNPYTMNECYSMNFTAEPYNQVSWKYSCKDVSTLTREIWWDSLTCTGIDRVTTDITAAQRGISTTFICDQSTDCPIAEISVTAANTMNPTAHPTNEPSQPTVSPTREPTAINQTINTFSCSVLCLSEHFVGLPCQCYEGCVANGDCCYDYETECYRDNIATDGESSGGFLGQCDNTLGAEANAPTMFAWKYAANICLSFLDLSALFSQDSNASAINASASNGHIGWQCVNNSYYMALFNGTDCSSDPMKVIQYTDDACAFGGAAWGYVACSEEFVATTPDPTTAWTTTSDSTTTWPTTTDSTAAESTTSDRSIVSSTTADRSTAWSTTSETIPANGNTATFAAVGGCVGQCESHQLCVSSTGQCEDKIVDSGCLDDAACIASIGEKYKCKQSEGFCYFSQCDDNTDCPVAVGDATYNCETQDDGEYNGIGYEYGMCVAVMVDVTGGVARSGVFVVIGWLTWFWG